MVDRAQLREEIIADEGFVPHAYQDHMGYWTLGTGFLVDKRKGGEIPRAVNDFWLDYLLKQIERGLDYHISWWRTLSPARQRALANMAYQLGVTGLMGFGNMLRALERGDYETVYHEALNSLWAQQTPKRARRIAEILRAG